ncbi:MAG: hypothetical protein KIS91_19555 [Anaerolineae bacterium]|nr:hypothetical protein [Anaerolineae bacterium]
MQEQIATEILTAHADNLINGVDERENYLRLFGNKDGDLADLMALAVRVRALMAPVRPSPIFRDELRRELLAAARRRPTGEPRPAWEVWRDDAEQWVDYARRRLPDWTPPLWAERPMPRGLVLAALGLTTGAGVWAYLRHRDETRRPHGEMRDA